jgi:hypothetical protein
MLNGIGILSFLTVNLFSSVAVLPYAAAPYAWAGLQAG